MIPTLIFQEFGPDNTPLSESVFTLPLLGRYSSSRSSRHRRSLRRGVPSLQRDRQSLQRDRQSLQRDRQSLQRNRQSLQRDRQSMRRGDLLETTLRRERSLRRDATPVKATLHPHTLNEIIAELNLTSKSLTAAQIKLT